MQLITSKYNFSQSIVFDTEAEKPEGQFYNNMTSILPNRRGQIAMLEVLSKIVDKKLYGASEDMLMNYLSFLDDKFNNVGIVGHQPGLQELAFTLVSSYAEGYDKVLNGNFSTSNAIMILLNIKRRDQISPRVGILIDYFDSKNIWGMCHPRLCPASRVMMLGTSQSVCEVGGCPQRSGDDET